MEKDQEKIVLIGAETMIGRCLLQLLLKNGLYQIHVLRHQEELLEQELRMPLTLGEGIIAYDIDIFDLFDLEPIFRSVDYVINCYGTSAGIKHSREILYKHNIIGVRTWVDVALSTGIKGFLHISTAASLGRKKDGSPCKESDSWQKNELHGHYNKSKFLGELEVVRGQSEGLNTILIHPTHVIGYGGILHIYLNQLKRNALKYPTGMGGYIGVRDVATFALKVLEAQLWGERFLINAANISHREVIHKIATLWGLSNPKRAITSQEIRLSGWIDLATKCLGMDGEKPSREWYQSLQANFTYDSTKALQTGLVEFSSIDSCLEEIRDLHVK